MKLQAIEPGTFLAEIRHSYLEDLEKGNGSPTQYSCLGNPMTRRSLAGYSSWGYKRVRHEQLNNHSNLEDYSLIQKYSLW